MKTILKSLVLIFITSFCLVSCDENKKQLREQVQKFNNTCPISLGGIMTINSVVLQDNTVEMKFSINESITPISLINSHKEDFKENLSMILSRESSKIMVENIVKANASFVAIFVGEQSGTRAELDFTSDELRTAQERFSNMTESQKLIASNIVGMKMRLPAKVDDITTMTGLSITPSALVYKYEVNDYETGESINQFVGLMKNITMSQMAAQIAQDGIMGERNRKFYEALIDCGQGVKVEYHESNTGNRATFDISISEIKDILSGKYQKNAPTMEDWNNLGKAVEELEQVYGEDSVGYYEETDYY
ncbi:hypothetical protein SAMN02910409_0572 [Prevotellaceae bacterium HUN156]|nr:hypothetical protein SAMN02910409_0572 [Prevotellaceae bacterium HUN156]